MATNLSLDPHLLDEVLRVSNKRTKKDAVTEALQEYVARREQAELVSLFGKIEWKADYDYKSQRQ